MVEKIGRAITRIRQFLRRAGIWILEAHAVAFVLMTAIAAYQGKPTHLLFAGLGLALAAHGVARFLAGLNRWLEERGL